MIRFKKTHVPRRTQILAPGPLVFDGFAELSHCCPGVVGVDGCLGELLVAIELGADEATLGVEKVLEAVARRDDDEVVDAGHVFVLVLAEDPAASLDELSRVAGA